MNWNCVPAFAVEGALTKKLLVGPAVWTTVTCTAPLVANVMPGLVTSVTVTFWEPCVLKVTLNVPVLFVRGPSAGKIAVGSVLAKCTVSVKPDAGRPLVSYAVTEKVAGGRLPYGICRLVGDDSQVRGRTRGCGGQHDIVT